MLNKKGYTLMELLVVIIIIGILAALALPDFGGSKERSLDKEGKAVLKLIQAAELVYRMEVGAFYPIPAGYKENLTGTDGINECLRLSIPVNSSWKYSVNSLSAVQQAKATRNKTGGRAWFIPFTSDAMDCADNSEICPPH